MNKINFIQKNSSHRASKKNYLFKLMTIIFSAIALATIITLQTMQWVTLRNLRQEKQRIEKQLAPLDLLVIEKQKLEKEIPSLEKRVYIMENTQPSQDQFLNLFNAIYALIGAAGSIESLSIAHKKLELTINLASIKAAQDFIEKLAALPIINTIDLDSIRKGGSTFIFSITGTLT